MKRYIFKYKGLLFFSLIFTIINAALSVIIAFILANIVNSAVESDIEKLKVSILFAMIYFLLCIIVGHITNYICEKFICRVMVNFKKDLFVSIMNRNFIDFNKYDNEYYLQQLTTLSDGINESYANSIFNITYGITLLILSIISIITIDYKILVIAIILGFIYLLIGNTFSKNITQYKSQVVNELSEFSTTVMDLFQGIDISRNYDNKNYVYGRFDESNKKLLKSIKIYNIKFLNLQTCNLLLGQGLIIVIIIVCSLQVIYKNFKIGELIAIAQLLANMINPLLGFAEIINEMKANKKIKESLINFIKYENDFDAKKMAKYSFDNMIQIKGLSFSYANKEIFRSINLCIEAGKKYAIIGNNGSGKSTFLKLILSYYHNYEGEILIDGINVKDLSSDSFKNLFSVVNQDFHIYDDTIAKNICFNNKFKEQNLMNIINMYELNQLSMNYDLFTYNAKKLSGGEKQKVAIARSQIANKPIMIFDEINSKLDTESSKKVLEAILKDESLTAIVVTHKLGIENLDMYDVFLKIEDKKIEEIKIREYLSSS